MNFVLLADIFLVSCIRIALSSLSAGRASERYEAKRLEILTFMLAPAPDVLGDDRDHVEP